MNSANTHSPSSAVAPLRRCAVAPLRRLPVYSIGYGSPSSLFSLTAPCFRKKETPRRKAAKKTAPRPPAAIRLPITCPDGRTPDSRRQTPDFRGDMSNVTIPASGVQSPASSILLHSRARALSSYPNVLSRQRRAARLSISLTSDSRPATIVRWRGSRLKAELQPCRAPAGVPPLGGCGDRHWGRLPQPHCRGNAARHAILHSLFATLYSPLAIQGGDSRR